MRTLEDGLAHDVTLADIMSMEIAPLGPPHPWDPQIRRKTRLHKLLHVPFFLLVLLPLILLRVFIILLSAVMLTFAVFVCRADTIYNWIMSVVGRCLLFAFGVWPGMVCTRGASNPRLLLATSTPPLISYSHPATVLAAPRLRH